MKYLVLIMMSLFVSACAHQHHGEQKSSCGCNKTVEEKKACGCDMKKNDEAHKGCNGCEATKHDHHSADVSPLMSDKITQKISQEEFSKIYTQNKESLGQKCTNPAMTYCGKTTKDKMVSETEASCLWTKVFRVTRETLPELDGSPCAKMIKGFAKK